MIFHPRHPVRDRWFLLSLFLVAVLALGLAQRGRADVEMAHDTAHYLTLARSIVRGNGLSNTTYWALNLPCDSLPHPDTYRAPLYPILIAAASRVEPDFFVAAKWVSVLAGALVVSLAYALARRRLGQSVSVSLVAATLTLAHHHLVEAGSTALTESTYSALALGALYAILGSPPRTFVAGVLVGLACLTRYQGLVLLLPCGIALALAREGRRRLAHRVAVFTGAALLVLLPWMIRNTSVAGSPLHTDLVHHVKAAYLPRTPFYRQFHTPHELGQPNEPLPLGDIVRLTGYRLWRLLDHLWFDTAGNPIWLAFAGVGAWVLVRTRPRSIAERTVWVFVLGHAGLAAATFAKARHLTAVEPILAVLAAMGLAAPWRRSAGLGWAATALCAVGFLLEIERDVRRARRSEPTDHAVAAAVAPVLAGRLGPHDAIMASSPYHFAYRLDRNAVSLPWSDDRALRELAARFRVRYVVITAVDRAERAAPGSFLSTGVLPPWLQEVAELRPSGAHLYEISPPNQEPRPPDPGSG
jgi:hypothetical protein